jgi:hypothetical protein
VVLLRFGRDVLCQISSCCWSFLLVTFRRCVRNDGVRHRHPGMVAVLRPCALLSVPTTCRCSPGRFVVEPRSSIVWLILRFGITIRAVGSDALLRKSGGFSSRALPEAAGDQPLRRPEHKRCAHDDGTCLRLGAWCSLPALYTLWVDLT